MQDHLEDLIKIRRTIHKYPEIGYQEYRTSKFICEQLDAIGVPYRSGIANTGVIAELDRGPGRCIVLRAEMDALPIQEDTDLEFASVNAECMHACGHDVHTTMLLGAIMQLKDEDFKGKIKFIFQPAEEGVYDDQDKKSGGQRIVEAGELDEVDYALSLHVHSLLEVGKLSYALGNALACTNAFTIEVNGKAGHAGAAPHLAVDAVLVSTSLIQSLYTIVSRDISPTQTGVLSISMINGGEAPNIVADKIVIRGTVRALDMEEYNLILKRMNEIIEGVARSFNTTINFSVDLFYPNLENDTALHQKLEPLAKEVFPNGVAETDPLLGGEDFAFYSKVVPSMYYFLGAKDTHEPCYFLHHPKVVINEDCMPYGVEFLTKAALHLLK